MRCFIALNLPMVSNILEVQKELKNKEFFRGKFTEPENIHLTLKFLGEIDENTISNIRLKLKNIKHKSFDSVIDEAGLFSERIVWLTASNVLELQREIDESLSELFPKEKRFMSHITIARIKSVSDKQGLKQYLNSLKLDIKGRIESFSLIKSTLTLKGSKYQEIERFMLVDI
ncbi:MAG: RNA 2',3'-cyclic phosphodiesterase [Nanoarchaeota archaeon]|nr:RNA 2',3'-cyclic phosphodiesterase [Nanoarchaeota archaeon]MBU1031297.1 RNA 2',3'-cyclic phosphodiesterase [Nanoarchaeota archaeon]MBU1849442.1 RNA 2',3'-cyclic phosphodiesterase [Nanoarchaeota archaeon]